MNAIPTASVLMAFTSSHKWFYYRARSVLFNCFELSVHDFISGVGVAVALRIHLMVGEVRTTLSIKFYFMPAMDCA